MCLFRYENCKQLVEIMMKYLFCEEFLSEYFIKVFFQNKRLQFVEKMTKKLRDLIGKNNFSFIDTRFYSFSVILNGAKFIDHKFQLS